MDNITIERIKNLHPNIRQKALDAYQEANNVLGRGVRLRFSYTLRTFAEQDALFIKRPKVTNARAGQSFHNYGLAFDIVLLYDKNLDGVFEEASWDMVRDGDRDGIADWLEVTRVLERYGFKNGFLKNGRKWDFPHFQMDFGYSWQRLLAKYKKGYFISGTKFVNL